MPKFSEWTNKTTGAPVKAPPTPTGPSKFDQFESGAPVQAPAPSTPAYDDDLSILQRMFDIKNTGTGESYLYRNRPSPQPTDDIGRIVMDTASRGFYDKASGGAAETAAARERAPDVIETPLDIGTAIATSPYRVESMLGGAGWGALE